mmetsp:Transcript_49228/g.110369  ORF Transcript_49228/g.110369 Transcript_49228/m.110369 type:complete len:528 (-) Transcript_49228:41-1624(-)
MTDPGEYVKLQLVPEPPKLDQLTPDARRFKAFKKVFTHTETSRVASLSFTCDKASVVRLAVASGTKVCIWKNGKEQGSMEIEGTVTKFKNVTTCTAWRADGRLLMTGEAGGTCAVIETATRKVLRRFRGVTDQATCAQFCSTDQSRAATGSKDGKLRLWDVMTASIIRSVNAHADTVKVVEQGFGGTDSWLTAGYDGKVKLWDLRVATGDKDAVCCLDCDHGSAVEVGACQGGKTLAVAGGQDVSIWDFAAGGVPMFKIKGAHAKAITAVRLSNDASSVLTAGFDSFVKVFKLDNPVEHVWTYKLPGPASALAWRPDERAFAVGLEDGQWQMRLLKETMPQGEVEEETVDEQMKRAIEVDQLKRKWSIKRSEVAVPATDDIVFDAVRKKKKKESAIDFAMRKFDYRKVIELMVETREDKARGFAVVEELLQRSALDTAVANMNEDLCSKVLNWLHRSFQSHAGLQQQLWFEALHTVLEHNSCLRPPSTPELCSAMKKIEEKVLKEMRMAESLMEIDSMLDVALALSS